MALQLNVGCTETLLEPLAGNCCTGAVVGQPAVNVFAAESKLQLPLSARTVQVCLPAGTPEVTVQLVFGVRHAGELTLPSTKTSYPVGVGEAAVQENVTGVFGVTFVFDGDCATGAIAPGGGHDCATSRADTPQAAISRTATRRMSSPPGLTQIRRPVRIIVDGVASPERELGHREDFEIIHGLF